MKIVITAALLAAAPLAVATAPITAPASPALACAAATASAETLVSFTPNAIRTSATREITGDHETVRKLSEDRSGATTDHQGHRDGQATVVVARSCI